MKKYSNYRYCKSIKKKKSLKPLKRRSIKRYRKKTIKYGGHINGNINGAPIHPGIPSHHMPLSYQYNNLDNTDYADAKLLDSGLVKVKVQ